MPDSAPDRGQSPVEGESRLALVTMGVLLGIAVVGAIAALVANALVDGMGTTVVVALVLLAAAAIGFAVVFLLRRAYLRDRRLGRVIERESWSGADLLPPG